MLIIVISLTSKYINIEVRWHCDPSANVSYVLRPTLKLRSFLRDALPKLPFWDGVADWKIEKHHHHHADFYVVIIFVAPLKGPPRPFRRGATSSGWCGAHAACSALHGRCFAAWRWQCRLMKCRCPTTNSRAWWGGCRFWKTGWNFCWCKRSFTLPKVFKGLYMMVLNRKIKLFKILMVKARFKM